MSEENIQHLLDAFTRPARSPEGTAQSAILASAKTDQFGFEGETLCTYRWGNNGPAVLLVHGWESQSGHWQEWIPRLLDAGYQVIALDLPAHGLSSGVATHVIQARRAVQHIGEKLGPLYGLISHSMGSAAALYAFAQGLRVNASVHLAGPVSLKRVLLRAATHCALTDSATQAFLQEFEQRAGASLNSMEITSLEKGLLHQALLLHDPDDAEVPFAESSALAQAWQTATLVPLQGTGHRRILKSAQAIDASLEHLGLHN